MHVHSIHSSKNLVLRNSKDRLCDRISLLIQSPSAIAILMPNGALPIATKDDQQQQQQAILQARTHAQQHR
jgi:hypothetical protein